MLAVYTSEGYISIDLEAELLEIERIIRQKKAKIENLFYDKINELDKELREKRVKILCEAQFKAESMMKKLYTSAGQIDSELRFALRGYTSEINSLYSTIKLEIYLTDRKFESTIRKEIEDMTHIIQAKSKHLRDLLSLTRLTVKKVERRLSLEAALELVLADKQAAMNKERNYEIKYKLEEVKHAIDYVRSYNGHVGGII